MTISWINGHSVRFIKTGADQSMLPVVPRAVSRCPKHLDAIISTVGPVEIVVNPIKCKATD